jgi:hypothetical protein
MHALKPHLYTVPSGTSLTARRTLQLRPASDADLRLRGAGAPATRCSQRLLRT